MQNKQSENITYLLLLFFYFLFLLARFTLDKAGSPGREPFRIVFQNVLQAWYPSKGFYFFTLYAIWPIYTWRTLPGPDLLVGGLV